MKETQLIEKLKENNEQAFKLLYKYFPKIRSYLLKFGASKQEAEDVYHEALYVLINKLQDPNFVLTSSVNTFLFSICKYKYTSLNRKKQKGIDIEIEAHEKENIEVHSLNSKLMNDLKQSKMGSTITKIEKNTAVKS